VKSSHAQKQNRHFINTRGAAEEATEMGKRLLENESQKAIPQGFEEKFPTGGSGRKP